MPSPDRLLPADPATREVARELLGCVEELPIVSPHGHVAAAMIAENTNFANPADLLVTPDHYITRLLHANGSSLESLGVGGAGADPRGIWREFCSAWPIFDGTASGNWLAAEFSNVFQIDEIPSRDSADRLYEFIAARLAEPSFRPRALMEAFAIEVLATTDDPLDDLSAHLRLRQDATFQRRVIPTFRPDAYVNAHAVDFVSNVQRLVEVAGEGRGGYDGYLTALRNRRQHFIDAGATATDHGARTPLSLKLDSLEAARLFERVRLGECSEHDRDAFEAHMLYEMARMSVEDGLVMALHPGSLRNYHPDAYARFGPDTGHDIPIAVEFTSSLRALLADFGTTRGFHLVLFTLDETTFSRELAPLAGFYPSVYLGSPWWFLDAPDAMLRFRGAVTETTGFSRYGGFVDDTRAFCSIPARHNVARRVEAAFLSRMVAEHRISMPRAREIIVDVIDHAPRRAFKL
ncbi:MAG: glucuronate isomerase [Acidimicrobiaceae bacterium]|nr:glucuronate isomerase [Acidimicrobiaceae bacterium]